ncbi:MULTISPECIES: HAMP domain-containing sensor histidine kinase [Cyanophyceae]|uniref:sensor histidine kinase n=1 Tax=Cyanophyceae TaxID=3028117 RepID=UPI001682C0EE|nr:MULTISPECIES: HAMP domain-containing sensor histidine kinase [Cyanophyceae]MBD1916423.1 HAMP domain-containing histidine kinase [Phormidium sp. FACHB-77]MBD2032715.1 HAMP domain-containing histidine kinase [Phormidium sp. FACHB-322]MBD2050087.1 HAMP domain-containing histidine kinase [Leptolyngbya sp. FACHB-60]
MASENPTVLFQARPPEGLASTSANLCEGRETWPLVHALAATLNEPDILPSLAEVLGTHLGAGACLLLCRYPDHGLSYTCWRQGEATASYQLGDVKSGSTLDRQRHVALELIQQTIDQAAGKARLSWQKGLAGLLRNEAETPAWLRTIVHCTAIAVDGAGFQGAMLLLGVGGLSVEPSAQANLASLGAIAFHQHYLQGQAQRNTEQLRYLNYLKEDFLSTLNHELRTPLTSMMLAIRMLRRPDLTPERSAMYLDILEQQCTREINLVNDLLMLQTLESKAPAEVRQSTDLGQLLTDMAKQSQEQFDQAQLTLALQLPSKPVLLATDPERLTKVLKELIGNARKYSTPQTVVTFALADNQAQNGRVTLQVSNLGTAIEAGDLPHIFDKFRRGSNATKDGIAGTGTGLALARGLVEQLGGTIKVSSQPIDSQLWQTCFTLEFECHDKLLHSS